MTSLNKTIGYILLIAGLVLIIWVLWQSYNIFTAKASAPLVFQTPTEIGSSGVGAGLQDQINQAVQKQLGQILSPTLITKVLNLAAWSMLALILIWAGSAISAIGVRMIRS